MTLYLGFDPGGGKRFGCAIYDSQMNWLKGSSSGSVDEAVSWAQAVLSSTAPAAAGIDTLLFWQSTAAGWRGADEWLRARYPKRAISVSACNSLYGAMSVQGALLARRLRDLWPKIGLTETHPKVLWEALSLGDYPRGLKDTVAVERWRALAAIR